MKPRRSDIIKKLCEFGLTEHQAVVYLAVKKLKKAYLDQIIQETGFKKTATTKILTDLVRIGLVLEWHDKHKKYYEADSTDKLYLLIEQSEWRLRHIKSTVDALIGGINQIAPSKEASYRPEIRYFEDLEGVRLVYNEILQHKEVFACVNVAEIAMVFPENLSKFATAVKENGTVLKEIVERSPQSKEYVSLVNNRLHEVKYFPKDVSLQVDYLIYGEYLTLIDFKANPPVSILIKDKAIADTSRKIFETVWESLPKA